MSDVVAIVRKHLEAEQKRIGAGRKNAVTEKLSELIVEIALEQAREAVAPIVEKEKQAERPSKDVMDFRFTTDKLIPQAEADAMVAAALEKAIDVANAVSIYVSEYTGPYDAAINTAVEIRDGISKLISEPAAEALAEQVEHTVNNALIRAQEVWDKEKTKIEDDNVALRDALQYAISQIGYESEIAKRIRERQIAKLG